MFSHRGFSLIELLIAVGITALVLVAVTSFGRDMFFLRSVTQSSIHDQFEARRLTKDVVGEVRRMSRAATGAYPIHKAGTSTLVFFVDVTGDGETERVRYFLDGTTLYRGVIVPHGTSPSYDPTTEEVEPYVRHMAHDDTVPVFEYFDGTYMGASTSEPLSYPLSINDIRHVRLRFRIDSTPSRPPAPLTVQSHGTIRNIKNESS